MTRLDDAIGVLRKAAGDRPFVLVVDVRDPSSDTSGLNVATSTNLPTYVARGLLVEANRIIDAKFPVNVDGLDDEE